LLANYVLTGAAVSGVIAGMFTGRFVTYWRAMNARRVTQTYSRSA
jgi:hypothetical protein